MDKFDNLIRQGEDIKAYKMLMKELYNGCKIGGTRKRLMERILEQANNDRYTRVELLPDLIECLQEASSLLNDIPHGNFYKEDVKRYELLLKKLGRS